MRRPPRAEGHDEVAYSELLDSVRGLRWRARRASRTAVPGIHPSRVRGTSVEFTEYRPYRQGDDLRRIDWKLFARSNRAHVRISEERAVTPTFVVVDASASMGYPEGAESKWSVASRIAVALVAVAHASGDPAGMIVPGESRATIPPRTRRGIVAEVARTLHTVAADGSAPVAPSLIAAARASSRIAIVSDFLGDLDETIRTASEIIASGRDVYAVHVIARQELDPPDSTSIVVDPETVEVQRSIAGDARTSYLRAFQEWREATATKWLASGAAYRVVVTEAEPVSHAVRRIVQDEPEVAQSR